MTLFVELVSILAPVFLTALIGFVWAKRKLPFDHAFVTQSVSYLGTPCLVFYALSQAEVDAASMGAVAGGMALCVLAFTAIGYVGLKLLGLPIRVHLPSLTTPNTGNMGLPVALFAFGQEGLAYAIAIMAALILVCFTLNIWIASGRASPMESLKQPMIWAAILGGVVMAGDIDTPRWLDNTTNLIGGLSIPLMLLALGSSMADLKVEHIKRSLGLGAWRIAMGFGVGWLVSFWLHLEGAAAGVLILQASMPAAVFAFLFAQLYDQRPAEVAGTIVMSTAISVITLPLILVFVL